MDDLEIKRQELCGRLVAREVYCCVSSLMYSVGQHAEEASRIFDEDYDDLLQLFERRDYEEAGRSFVSNDADLNQLEEIADKFGYWSDVLHESDVPEGCENVDEYIEAHPQVLPVICSKVEDLVDAEACGWEQVCDEYNLDPDYLEVYEHWIVSSWLAKQLEEHGEVVGEFAGLTVWGRCTTGQAISMDGVIRAIAAGLYPEEWNDGSKNPV